MTATIINGITNNKSKNFEKKVANLLPEDVNEIYLSSCGMEKVGNGLYNYFLDLSVNDGERIMLSQFTNDSMTWDEWTDLERGSRKHDNFNKSLALRLLENCFKELYN